MVMSKTADPYRIQVPGLLPRWCWSMDLPRADAGQDRGRGGTQDPAPLRDMNMAYGAATCGAEMVETRRCSIWWCCLSAAEA